MRTIDFYFDFISPYAYVGWFRALEVAKKHGCNLHAIPVLFAGLLRAFETKGPAETSAKRSYIFKDVVRKAHRANLPLVPPPAHPFNPLAALRAVTAVKDETTRNALVSAIYQAVWGEGRAVDTAEIVAELAKSVGLDGTAITQSAALDETKNEFRKATDDAISKQIFGVPSMLIEGELFWGVDSIESLEDFLTGKDPFKDAPAKASYEKWMALPATSSRK